MSAPPAPNMMPNPISQKQGVPMQKSMRFFIKMLPVFFAQVKPASHIEKPACMKNTSAEPTRTHIVLMPENMRSPFLHDAMYEKQKRRPSARHRAHPGVFVRVLGFGMPSAIFPAEPAVDFHGGGTTVGESAHHQ